MKNSGFLDLSKPFQENSNICTISKEILSCDAAYTDDSKEPVWKCRYVATIIGFLLFLSAGINRSIMSVVMNAMVNNTALIKNSKVISESCPEPITNSTADFSLTTLKREGEFMWSPEIQGYILGCFFIGQVLIQFPAGRLAERYGWKWLTVGSLLTTSALNVLIPPFLQMNAFAVISIQAIKGFSQGFNEVCVTVLTANWCPKSERGFLCSIMQTANLLGPALGNVFAGYVSELPGGWRYVFYSVGGSGLVIAVYVFFFGYESPKEHPWISNAELKFILSQQERILNRRRPKLPWRQIVTSVPVYALIFAMFGRFWTVTQFLIVHSTFLGTILHYPIAQNGLLSAVPFLLAFFVAQVSAWISLYIEKKEIVSVNFLRKFFTLISSLGYSLCLLGMYIAGCNSKLSVVLAILSMGFTGFGTTGSLIVCQDMSPTFSGTLFSLSCTAGFLACIIFPVYVGFLTDGKQTLEQWNNVFFTSIGIVMSSTIMFLVFGSAKIQPWNFVEEKNKKNVSEKPRNDKNEEITRF